MNLAGKECFNNSVIKHISSFGSDEYNFLQMILQNNTSVLHFLWDSIGHTVSMLMVDKDFTHISLAANKGSLNYPYYKLIPSWWTTWICNNTYYTVISIKNLAMLKSKLHVCEMLKQNLYL